MVDDLMKEAMRQLNELLSCKSPTGNSYEKENNFFNTIERVKAELIKGDDKRAYADFSVYVMHKFADELSDRNHYSWIAELELKTKAILLS